MAITRGQTKAYVVPNGRVDFNLYPSIDGVEKPELAKGLRYLGATKELTLTQENETLEHKSSECGFNKTDMEIVISSKLSGSLTVENITSENLAMFFAGDVSKVVQQAKTNNKEVMFVYPSLGYKLGKTKENPNGVFSATITKIEAFDTKNKADAKKENDSAQAGTTLVENTDFEYNKNTGYLAFGDTDSTKHIKEEGTWVLVTYDLASAKRDVVISKGTSIIGELVVRGCNAYGENREYRLPKVRLSANGDISLKGGEDFITIGFDITALEGDEPMLYVNGLPTTV